MSRQLATLLCMMLVIGCASLVGRVSRAITLDNEPMESSRSAIPKKQFDLNHLGKSTDNLMWFMQVSDLHLSIFHDPGRISDLTDFCKKTVDIINPLVVLASGDLTDAKTIDHVGSRQYLQEWEIYRKILEESKVTQKTVWLDIRGNHDNFNVPALNSHNNFYQNYSVQGKVHKRSYMYTAKKDFNSIAFIGVDACLLPGPKRPFNFIGVLHPDEMSALSHFEMESRKSNYTIWFGHYPTSCILSPDPGIRNLMQGGLAYLCGHLHTLGGVMPQLYTRQQMGSLELELGDWKHNRMFRIVAIDNGLLSFIDVPHGEWPIILITNPKHNLYFMPQKEPIHLIEESSHIRVLVWSLSTMKEVLYRIDKSGPWYSMTKSDGPLYVANWDPSQYATGTHTLEITGRDKHGREQKIEQSFSVSGELLKFGFWQRIILMSNVSLVFQFLFGTCVFVCIVPMCILKWFHHMVLENRMTKPRFRYKLIRSWCRKLWILVSIDKVFWPLMVSSMYIPFGPWFVGEILDGHTGVAFAWGIFVNGSYLPGSLTYAYGFLQMLFFHIPLGFIIAHSVDMRYRVLVEKIPDTPWMKFSRNLLFIVMISMQTINAYFFYLAYGTMAFILGPLRTWTVILGSYQWYTCSTLHQNDLRAAAYIWSPNMVDSSMNRSTGSKNVDDENSSLN